MTASDAAARRLDGIIDTLLRGDDLGVHRPTTAEDLADGTEAGLVATARLLHGVLPRFHPRFGFEEALAARLARSGTPADEGSPIPFPDRRGGPIVADARGVWERYRRELVAGGAIASGVSIALPLAGAALVRWRRSRSSHTPGGLL